MESDPRLRALKRIGADGEAAHDTGCVVPRACELPRGQGEVERDGEAADPLGPRDRPGACPQRGADVCRARWEAAAGIRVDERSVELGRAGEAHIDRKRDAIAVTPG